MHVASDYIHSYKDAGGRPAHCRVRIYLPEDMHDVPVVICSELPNNPGGSITNSAEVIAEGVIRANELPTPLVWMEHWPKECTNQGTETFELVVFSSACSGSIFGNGQMLVMRTIEDPTNPLGELVSAQRIAVGLDHFALAVYPLGFYGVQPRALLGKKAAHDPYPFCALLDFSVVRSEPAPDLFGDVPTGVVPDENQHLLAHSFELLAAPLEKLRRYGTDGPPIHEPQPRLVELGHIESVAGDGFRVRIVFGDRLLNETQRLPFLRPATEGGHCQPTPPALVQETNRPGVGIGLGHFHQSIAPPFFFHTGGQER
jgi:hypothetical protein